MSSDSPQPFTHRRHKTSRQVERRGRGPRGLILPPHVPRYASRSTAFDEHALEAFARIDTTFHDELTSLDLAVDMVPRMRLREGAEWPDSVAADGIIALGRFISTSYTSDGTPIRPRIVLFRKPIEERCADETEMQQLLQAILTKLVAYYLNVEPELINPFYGDGPQV
ncbi:MAG: metallopeptidase family protein [Lawsonella sp.]